MNYEKKYNKYIKKTQSINSKFGIMCGGANFFESPKYVLVEQYNLLPKDEQEFYDVANVKTMVLSNFPIIKYYAKKTETHETKPAYKVMTYNVFARGASHYQKEHHEFHFDKNVNPLGEFKQIELEHIDQSIERYLRIKNEIEKYSPDIVLLQEVDNYFFTYILKHMPNYQGFFKTIVDFKSDLSNCFGTAMIWKDNMFRVIDKKILDSNSYKLSGKSGHGDFKNKNATFVKLQEHNNPERTLTVVSTHLSGDLSENNIATTEKQNLINYIIDELQLNPSKYTIVGGDLNCPLFADSCEPGGEPCCYNWIESIMRKNNFTKISYIDPKKATTCDFDYSRKRPIPTVIDTIFFSNSLAEEFYDVQDLKCDSEKNTVYQNAPYYADILNGSDHAWVMAKFFLL